MSVAVVVASGGFRFRGLRFCKAVQVGRRMLSYCEASSWQVFSTRVSKHHMFSPLTLVKFFCLESVLVQIFSRLRSNPYWPGLWHLRASPAITGFVPSQPQTLCSYNCRSSCARDTRAKISTFAQTKESNCVLVRRLERRTLAHVS